MSVAPYDLDGVVEDKKLTLNWKEVELSPVLTYETGSLSYGVGMTGSGTRTTYAMIKFTPEQLAEYAGQEITHINFGLYSTDLYTANVVVMDGFNIMYKQEVELSTLVNYEGGMNSIRLDKPYTIEAGKEMMIGYLITYANGVKPMLCDEGPAVTGYGNLISASASSTSWKTLLSYGASLDYNWRINATLKKADKQIKAVSPKSEGVTYNLYYNDKSLVTGLTEASYVLNNATSGEYTVTAVKDSKESAQSNVLDVEISSSVESLKSKASTYYDADAEKVVLGEESDAKVYTVNGVLVKVALKATVVDMKDVAEGVYIVSLSNGDKVKIIK